MYERYIRDQVKCLHLEQNVVFAGWLSGTEKADAFEGSDLFVLLSDNENYGITAMEAAYYGLPAVLTEEVYTCPDLVAAGSAVASPQDPELAAEVIDTVLGDPEQLARIRSAALIYAREHLDSEVVSSQYDGLLRGV
jgi:glycosyltransferase involved in cell wall biosynthesis